MSSCTLPWTKTQAINQEPTIVEEEDSAFLEPEYSNPSSFESLQGRHHARPYHAADDEDDGNYSSPCPDYEEVDPLQIQQLRQCLQNTSLDWQRKSNVTPLTNGLVYNLASEGVFRSNQTKVKIGLNSPALVRNVRNRWSANLETMKGYMSGGDLRSVEEAQKQETIMKSVICCIHKVRNCD